MKNRYKKQERPCVCDGQASLPNNVSFCGAFMIAQIRCCEASSFYLIDKMHVSGRVFTRQGGGSW